MSHIVYVGRVNKVNKVVQVEWSVSGGVYVMKKLNATDLCIIRFRKATTKDPAGKGELESVAYTRRKPHA